MVEDSSSYSSPEDVWGVRTGFQESSNGWNNAGTGHSALCEPNYTPEVCRERFGAAGEAKIPEFS